MVNPSTFAHAARMAYPSWLPLLLGFLTAVGPISTDMYLPAFPALEASLRTPDGSAQITLATWFVGLAVGQLTQGSLSDRFGRRYPLIIGTAIYTLASAGCALSPNLFTLSLMRFVAGFSGSASMVIPRAVVRDLADGHEAARLMSRLILVMGAAPILAPTLGGLVLTVGSWRTIFWVATFYGALCTLLVALKLPDTIAAHHRVRLGLVGLLHRYADVVMDRLFLSYALLGGFGMFGMFAYIGGSSPVLIERFHFTPPQYGVLFGISAGMFIASSQAGPHLVRRFGAGRILRLATSVYLAAALILLACALLDLGGVWGIVPPIMVVMGCMGLIMPNAAVGALSSHASRAGTASAVMGTLQFTLAAISGALVGYFSDGTARPLSVLLVIGALAAVAADRLRPQPISAKRIPTPAD
ncbi:MAG: multidrug effflux MFS transporter [Acetobacteraceae bacterium]|nr:multidrug effflux MFS transporter [Acetobacteraceae bacterium]